MPKISRKVQRYGLEFLTVFLGVSLSLLAENWRQRRADANAERDSLVRLYGDMELEEGDIRINIRTAEGGLRAARWIVANGARGHAADSVSRSLTDIGQCSFFIPYTSEYTALKSSGRLSVIEDNAIRERIVSLYEMVPFITWLQERDCILTSDLMDSLLGKLEYVEPRRARNSRYPAIVFRPGQEALLEDRALRDRVVRLATQRQYLILQNEDRLRQSSDLRKLIVAKLQVDSSEVARQVQRQRGGRGRGRFGGAPDSTRGGPPDSTRPRNDTTRR